MALQRIAANPLLRASATSCCFMAAGDALCQVLRAKLAGKQLRVDPAQTARFALVGAALHGPFFYAGYRWLDGTIGASATLQKAMLKTALGQVTLFPTYTVLFFTTMGTLEGMAPQQCVAKLQRSLPATLATGSAYWPAVNMLNFLLVPPSGRVVCVNVAGLFWNAFLSWANATYGTAVRVPPQQGAASEAQQRGPKAKAA